MKLTLKVLMLASVFALVASLISTVPGLSTSDEGKVRVMVQFVPGKAAQVQTALKVAGGEIHYTFEELDTFAVTLPSTALFGIEHNPNVILVEEDALRYPISVMPSAQPLQLAEAGQTVPYGIDMVQARDVWDANRDGVVDAGAPTGSNRKLCIIDSGLYTGHEDFQGINATGYAGNLVWNQDGFGHGSHVAGTIAAMNNALGVVGVTPGTVSLYIVRVFGDDGAWAYSSTLIDAAYKCRDAGANIISMSLGGSRASTTERSGFASLYSGGILSIAAAGNAGTSAYSYPGSYDSVVSVAAIDINKVVADFSQYNSQVELAAPGVGVLSTVPYLDLTTATVDGVVYSGGHIEFSARGTASGLLVNGGICDATGAWSGKVVLCERGVIDFYTKVNNVKNSGGVAALIYNNIPGGFLGTLGEGNSSTIIGVSLSQADGQYLVASKLGSTASVNSTFSSPGSGYEAWDGTSMATPHVSAVAALVWSAFPTKTNAEIRAALTATAQDLGTAGRDVYYGFGLVQAADAIAYLGGGGGSTDIPVHVANLTGTYVRVNAKSWKASVKVTLDPLASGLIVTGNWTGGVTGTGTCTTTNGVCTLTSPTTKSTTPITFTVTNITKDGYIYTPQVGDIITVTVSKP
jgi:serine protease